MLDFLLFWGNLFDKNAFEVSTRIVEIIWSAAELLLVFSVLRLFNMAHIKLGLRPIRIRWLLFFVLLIANPVVLFIAPGPSHDKLMLANFFLLIFSGIMEWEIWLNIFRQFFNPESDKSGGV